MKISNISFLNYSPFKAAKAKNNRSASFGFTSKEIVQKNQDGTKTLLKQFFPSSTNTYYDYVGFLDKHNNLLRNIIFDRRYNEIRAIEYQQTAGGFNVVHNTLSVSFDKNKNIRNVYFINQKGDKLFHNVLNDKHGLTITCYDKDRNNIDLSKEEFKKQFDYFIDYTNSFLKEAEDNNLFGADGVLCKFRSFYQNVL